MTRPPAATVPAVSMPDRLQAALQHIQAGRGAEAKTLLEAVLAADARNPDALHLLGIIHLQAGEHARALALVSEALAVAEPSPLYWNTLGGIQRALGRTAEAVKSYRRAVELAPGFAQAHVNGGLALHALGRADEAEAAYRRAVELLPDHGRAHAHLGAALFDLGRNDEAAAAFARALALGPAEPALRLLHARALMRAARHAEAADALGKALAINPGDRAAAELLYECRAILCDWPAYGEVAPFYRKKIESGRFDLAGETMFPLTLPSLTRADHLAFARVGAARIAARVGAVPARPFARLPRPHPSRPRFRIGYLSGNFREHAVARLAAELFELHDRGAFEVYGYSAGEDDGSALRARVVSAFDRFTEFRMMPAAAAADRIVADEVDVLVALDGFAPGGVPELLALRSAPVQVSFLGYPATMGAAFADYIVADRFVLPPEHAADYAEAPAYLPDCYLPFDRKRAVDAAPARAALGLPERAFVFACFAAGEKITPAVFEAWMSLLAGAPGSVLWLSAGNPAAMRNLRAAAAGLADRLVFAPPVSHAAHLARLGAADLCLDTFPYGSHAGAAEALAAGVPVVTCVGETFAARVAGSALSAAGLPELITGSLAEYRALAARLAADREVLRGLREKLAAARAAAPLFDTPRFVRALEALYRRMWEKHVAGEAPAMLDAKA